jgi:hypothetical protein
VESLFLPFVCKLGEVSHPRSRKHITKTGDMSLKTVRDFKMVNIQNNCQQRYFAKTKLNNTKGEKKERDRER